MSRIETIGDATLYLGDCREILPTLGKVDAVVTDPPYGINHVKGSGGKGAHTRRNIKAVQGDNKPFDPAPLLSFRNVIMWGADHFYPRLPDRGSWIAFDKLDGMKPWDSFSDVEFAWCSQESAARIFSLRWKGLACVKAHEGYGVRVHPMQKPISLMRWCIEQFGDKQKVILDPFMGSGTTGVAALQLGRQFVGIEIDSDHFDIACRRVDEASKQPTLFSEPAEPAPEGWDEIWAKPFDFSQEPK